MAIPQEQTAARLSAVQRERIEQIAAEAGEALRAEFPEILHTTVSFGTEEGDDAFLWATIPAGQPELRRRVLAAAAAKTAPYLLEGISILPQVRFPRDA